MQFLTIALLCVTLGCVTGQYYHDHGPASYKYEYGVHDPHTGDVKSQYEHADHGHVRGAYSLKEPDGTTRLVEYTAGPHSGFNAVVKKIGHAVHPAHYGQGLGGIAGGGAGGFYGGYQHRGIGGESFVGPTHYGYGGLGGHRGYY